MGFGNWELGIGNRVCFVRGWAPRKSAYGILVRLFRQSRGSFVLSSVAFRGEFVYTVRNVAATFHRILLLRKLAIDHLPLSRRGWYYFGLSSAVISHQRRP